MLLTARNLSKSYNLRMLFRGVSLSVERGDRIGLIGPNGAGKSTLLKLLADQAEPDEGQIAGPKGVRTVYVPQRDDFPPGLTSREAALAAADRAAGQHDDHEREVFAEIALGQVGFDETHASAPAASLSGGWRKRLSLAAALASCANEPDLILLDEPTNHLDLDGIRWLERFLTQPPGGTLPFASIFVTHDRTFLENVATRIIELSRAYPSGTLDIEGNYSEFLRRKREFLDGQARTEQAIANQVRKDLDWLSRGPQARRTKSKSRIESSHGRIDELAEMRRRSAAAQTGGARVDFGATDRQTRKLIVAAGVGKSLGGRRLFSGVDITLGVGDCLGLLGPNGSGKTTFLRVLTGELAPDEGDVRTADPAPRVEVFSQHREDFDPATPLREALWPVSDQVQFRGRAMHITAWSRRFLFRDEQLSQPVSSLSGGELARIHIARMMLRPADVLVLDEPTNDLDIPTLELLEESLEDFAGALVLVTHDRAMLDRLATQVLSLDGKGNAGLFASVDQAVRAQERATLAAERTPPRPGAKADNPPPQSPPTAEPKRKKLSYNEQREYEGIEARILEAENRVASLEATLAESGVQADHARMARVCEQLSEAQRAVQTLYERWQALEAKVN